MAKTTAARTNPALRLALIRQLHVYVSVFVAPTLLFFAITGALQTFRIPDQKTAPVLLVKLARLHKDDVFAPKPVRPKRPEGAAAGKPAEPRPPKAEPKASTTVLKWFFSMASLAIAISTLLGLWMALAYHKRRAVMWALLIAGAAAPVLILMS
jgi:hypothetical protein